MSSRTERPNNTPNVHYVLFVTTDALSRNLKMCHNETTVHKHIHPPEIKIIIYIDKIRSTRITDFSGHFEDT